MTTDKTSVDPSLVALLPPLAERLAAAVPGQTGMVVAGICGAQGSGKTTLAHALEAELATHGKRALTLSLDDFYLPKETRTALGRDVHPLCVTRGVPGTHDMGLYSTTLAALASAGPQQRTSLPVFSKLDDDRLPHDQRTSYVGRPDVVLFEGWCVGAQPAAQDRWRGAINDLEAVEDPDGVWWRWWNEALSNDYWPLWCDLDPLILIRVPGIESVVQSRIKQEAGLAAAEPGKATMDEAAVRRFVAHYERLTLRIWDEMPARAHVVIDRDDSFTFSITGAIR
ncbi:MAG: kinase [Pseudomonadota bacterium]